MCAIVIIAVIIAVTSIIKHIAKVVICEANKTKRRAAEVELRIQELEAQLEFYRTAIRIASGISDG